MHLELETAITIACASLWLIDTWTPFMPALSATSLASSDYYEQIRTETQKQDREGL